MVVVAAAGYWFYAVDADQAANAERAPDRQAVHVGREHAAGPKVCRTCTRMQSTSAGVQAAMLLAQIDYDAGKFQDGISILQKMAGSSAASGVQTTILSLEGDGYAQMKKLAEAGKAYEDAAKATSFETERAFQLAKAARAYESGGNAVKAKEVWTSLLNDPKGQTMSAEARVRLGELSAATAKR